jgi:cytochrome c oxidase cbb3-type subunit 3
MTEQTQDKPSDHAYDGIQEYDNPLPGWWTWLWAATIVFAICYFSMSVISGGQFSAVAAYDRAVLEELKRSGGPLKGDAQTLMRLTKDPDSLSAGAIIFATNCVACHGRDASGLAGLGPNMTDDYYIHVRKIDDIPDVVTHGRKNGAMPAWGNRLSPNEIVQVSAYIASLRGLNRPGKSPEGQLIPPWSAQ